ncbi:MAG: putative inorganic carbon transporter subunit DabA, partial [Allorhizobium sp.]
PVLQAAFCIDVRSEVFRRALERVDPAVRTLGFAGFFGLGAGHKGFASDVSEHRLPVLLKPSVFSCSAVDHDEDADQQARFSARATRAWGRFKLAAVSSFAFVEAMGPVYAGKLMRDGLGFGKGKGPDAAKPRFAPSLDLDTRAVVAETVLKAMSLTEGFGRFVLIAGHGANVVNNPYASALHCGACGGYAGDVNARLLADLLNDRAVREKLAVNGITIPADTVFLGGLHDTTTDSVTLFEGDLENDLAAEDIVRIRRWLAQAGSLTRAERARRLPRATGESVIARSKDWSEVRPELGLAGCRAFIAAPRTRTAGRSLEGQAFLHDYVWKKDEGFKILELILTAPVVVASWISLQYFGSSVAPSLFGAGNKLLHNVVGGIGVVEGNGGNMRAGLPWQSVHDGEKFVHEPLRLTVAVEASREAIADILKRHAQVRALFDNGWLSLFALDEQGQMAWRYTGNLGWTDVRPGAASSVEQKAAS